MAGGEWTKKASVKLELLIMEMMENQGYVIFDYMEPLIGRTPEACEGRARRMGLLFNKKIHPHTERPIPEIKTKVQRADEYMAAKGVNYAAARHAA